jgi:hemoglobin/transferrin/lactoferrin receptor protein
MQLKFKRTLCGVSALVLMAASGALAEEAAPVSSKPTKGKLEVFVTASRGEAQNPLDVAQSVSSVSRQDLEERPALDIDDAIRSIPNVGMAPAEGNPNFWQEGFSIRGLGAQRVLTLSDGIRQAGQGIGYGGGNLSLYDTFGVERIEVLKGAASVLYGTDAFGGVVNVITRNPKEREEFGTNAGARYTFDGSRDMNRVGAYIDVGDKAWGTVIGGGYTRAEEPHLPDGIDPASGRFRDLSLWSKTDFRITNDTTLRFIANLTRASDVLITDSIIPLPIATFPPPGSSLPIVSPLYFNFPTYQRSVIGAELTTENLGGSLEQVKTGLYWQQLYRVFHRETAFYPTFSPGFAGPPLFVNPAATVTRSTVDTSDRMNTLEWQTQARWNFEPHVLTAGLDVGYDTTKLPETETQQVVAVAGVGPVTRAPSVIQRTRAEADQYRVGAYLQDSISWKNFEFVPGVRADMYSVNDDQTSFDDTESGVSGSLGTIWHQTDTRSVYLNLATGFRAPDLGERFQTGIVNLGAPTQIIGKADLDSERAYSAEWGIKQQEEKFDAEFALFYNQIENYIGVTSAGVVQGFLTDQYDNLGTVKLYGGEVGGRYRLTDRASVYANTGRTWTHDQEKIDVRDWAFNYGADYKQPLDMQTVRSVTAAVNVRSVLSSEDKTPSSSGNEPFNGSSFTVVDLSLKADLGKTDLGRGSLITGVRNVLDRKYQEPFFSLYQPDRHGFVAIQFEY